MLGHFNYAWFDASTVLLTNDFGRHIFLSNRDFTNLVTERIEALSGATVQALRDGLFLIDPLAVYSDELIGRLRDMKGYVFSPTALHIFVVTNSCNHRCVYCQAQATPDRSRFMTLQTGMQAVDVALQSPSRALSFEFQGGEPLLNFPVIRGMIEHAESQKGSRSISYSIVSNLTLLSDEVIAFIKKYRVAVSTSLDGPQPIHDRNRPFLKPGSSYACVRRGVAMLRAAGVPAGAIQTTTRHSLGHAAEIVDEYARLGFGGIFIRPLTPLGFAKSDWEAVGYTAEEFLQFYREAFERVLWINKTRGRFPEQHAQFFLKKILCGRAANYMELRSPCGAGIGQLAYYYDGKVYTCDEARMVAESGDDAFFLGDVSRDSYSSIVSSKTCYATCAASVLESIPSCCDCVYQSYCGVCPVISYALDRDVFVKVPSREALLRQILRSADYLTLQNRAAFAPCFEEHFSQSRLERCSPEELAQIAEALPVLPTVLDDLIASIHRGAGPHLLPEDRPDFTDKESLDHLAALLRGSSGRNYSNIPPEEFMLLFEESTVKRLGKNFARLPFGCADYESEIARLFPSQVYCISESEIETREQLLQNKIDRLKSEKARLQSDRRMYRLFKALLGLCFFMLPGIVSGLTGALSVHALAVCTLFEIVLVLVFWIWG